MTIALDLKNGLWWIQRLLVDTTRMKEITPGPLICCYKGDRWFLGKIVELDPMFQNCLKRVQAGWKDVIPAGGGPSKLSSIYYWSLRKGWVARVWNMKLQQAIIESNDRLWRSIEQGQWKQLMVGMMEHYLDAVPMVETLLQYLRSI